MRIRVAPFCLKTGAAPPPGFPRSCPTATGWRKKFAERKLGKSLGLFDECDYDEALSVVDGVTSPA